MAQQGFAIGLPDDPAAAGREATRLCVLRVKRYSNYQPLLSRSSDQDDPRNQVAGQQLVL
jgi:hypothetical protein